MHEPSHTVAAPDGPLFVVGPSRSGTSLMRAILNGHPSVELAGETHHFDDLRVRMGGSAALDEEQRRTCEDYYLRLSHRPYGHGGTVEGARLDRGELRRRAAGLGSTADAHFQAYCELVAEAAGATVWGDKTPRHIFRIGEILEAYPSARVVVMLRDPRSVVLSYRDWKNDQGGFDFARDPEHRIDVERDNDRARRSYDIMVLSLLWRSQARAALQAVRRFGSARVRLVRYEDLVEDAGASIAGLCDWLGLAQDPAMADVPILNSSFAGFDRTAGVSRHSLARWTRALSEEEIGLVQSACGTLAAQLGYERHPARASVPSLVRHWGGVPVASVRALFANRERTGKLVPYVARRVELVVRQR